MRTLSPQAGYRTNKPLLLADAERFAACLRGNRQYRSADVVASRSAGKYHVVYQPADPKRLDAIVAAAQASREERAEAQAGAYDISPLPGEQFQVVNLVSGEVYTTSAAGCTCKDYEYRCHPTGLRCKHMVLVTWLQEQEEQSDEAPSEGYKRAMETGVAGDGTPIPEPVRRHYYSKIGSPFPGDPVSDEASEEAPAECPHRYSPQFSDGFFLGHLCKDCGDYLEPRLIRELREREAQDLSSRIDGSTDRTYSLPPVEVDDEFEARQHARRLAADFGDGSW